MAQPITALAGSARVIDLTHALTPDFPLFPVYDPVDVADRFAVSRDGFFARRWCLDEHSGTHVDSPAHFGGEPTVDGIDPTDLVLELAVLDVRDRVARDHDAVVGPDDVLAWERRHGRLPERAAVFALTGWDARAGDAAAYLNADESGVMHFPSFGEDLSEFLKAERPGVRAIGVDVGSLDVGTSTDYPVHVSWLGSNRFGIENLTRLEAVPERGAVAVVGVPRLGGGSGAPARILALT